MTIGDKFLYGYGDHVSDFANDRMARETNTLLRAEGSEPPRGTAPRLGLAWTV
jgi:hypothetical protein